MFRKVNFRVLAVILLISALFVYDFGYTHSGRTDSRGGHYNRKTGEYHYHGGAKPRAPVNVTPATPKNLDDTEVVPNPTIAANVSDKVSRRSALKLAAWNIRSFSDNSRDDTELHKIAQTVIDYDFIAISELRDETVLKRIQRILSESGAEYGYLISAPVGRQGSPYRERYGFLYYKGLVSVVQDGAFYPDAADGKDDFVRDPYWATFRAGKFDFSVIVVHVVWGDTVAGRQAEVMELAEVYQYVQQANGAEDDVLLVGDFNREPDDTVAYRNLMTLPSMTHLFRLPQKSHIRDSSLYDNIFFQTDFVTEYLGRSGIDKFDETDFGNDDSAANLAVSDHRPVWALFRIDGSAGSSASLLNEELRKLPETNPNLRLDRAWLNRVYPNANKVSTNRVSSENQSSSEPEISSSKYPACKVCGGGSVITKYGKKSHSSTCRYVINTKYPTRSSSSYSSGTVRVKGYYRKDGTYVKPHTRRKPKR